MITPPRRTSLPRYNTAFIGRVREMELVTRSVLTNTFTCILGPGGVGKTRLAAESVAALPDRYVDCARFVDLSGVAEPHDLIARIASAIDMRDSAAVDLELLLDYARDLRALLILDSCERLDTDCLLVVQDLLAAAGDLTILAMSRRSMAVDGARLVTLAPLPTPPVGMSDPRRLREYEAVQLFVDRAQLVTPQYRLGAEQANSVGMLCNRVDGLPLALELAAAWIRTLSVDQIIARMDVQPGFPRATSGSPRHQTLEALTAGSFELCTRDEQILWTRLSIFEDSFELAAIEHVCSQPPLDQMNLLGLLASLVDQSVVIVDDVGTHSRYRLLNMIREHGRRKLSAQDLPTLRSRHLEHYASALQRLNRSTETADEDDRLNRLSLDYPNTVAAIQHAMTDSRSAHTGLGMAAELLYFWYASGRLTEGRRVLRFATTSTQSVAAPVQQGLALCVNAYLAILQSETRSARKLLELAASIGELRSDSFGRGLFTQIAAMVEIGVGNVSTARAMLDQAIEMYGQLDDTRSRIYLMDALGVAAFLAGLTRDSARAVELAERGLDLSESMGDRRMVGYIEYTQGVDRWFQQDVPAAVDFGLKVLGYTRDRLLATHCVELLAWCAARRGQHAQAARLFGAADRSWHLLGGRFSGFGDLKDHRGDTYDSCVANLGADAFRVNYEAGSNTPWQDVPRLAEEHAPSPKSVALAALTRREREIAELVAEGLSNRDIATRLTISQRTVETHVEHILAKLNLDNRTMVARIVHRPL